jgi:hypothetical protein
MANKAVVKDLKLNINKTFKSGKSFDGDEITFQTEKNQRKTEFIFARSPMHKVVQGISVGDTIEVSYEKNGEYFNLSNITLVEKGSGVVSPPQSSAYSKPSGGYAEPPEKQASIQRQNALTNATTLVTAALEQGSYKKATPSAILVDEVLKIAEQFTAFNSGDLQKTTVLDTSSVIVGGREEDDVPFDVDGDEFGA